MTELLQIMLKSPDPGLNATEVGKSINVAYQPIYSEYFYTSYVQSCVLFD